MTQERVALFVPTLEGGGAERVIAVLANRFASHGVKVDLLLQRAKGPYLKTIRDGVSVIDLNARRLAFCLWPLYRYFRRARPSATLSTPSSASIVAALAWMVAGRPGRLVVREATTPSVDDAFRPTLRSRVSAAMRRKLYHRVSRVVAPSAGIANDLSEHDGIGDSHIQIIPNPIEIDEIRRLAEAPLADHSLNGSKVVLAVGALTELKDFPTLIRAFARVASTRAASLVILGEGEERQNLGNLAKELGVADRVILPGFVENPFAYMKRASVVVLSSRYEGLPNALLQGLAVGLPLVSTDCPSGGPKEILEGGRWGRLVPVNDCEAMAAAITAALDGSLEQPSLAFVKDRYDADVISRRYLSLLLNRAVECRA